MPTLRAERADGRVPLGCATTVAAWVLHLRGLGAPVKDPGAGPALEAANSGDLAVAVPAVLETLEPGLGGDTAWSTPWSRRQRSSNGDERTGR